MSITCPRCKRVGVITDPELVARIGGGWRPQHFRCHRSAGGCGAAIFAEEALLQIAWDTPATPFKGPDNQIPSTKDPGDRKGAEPIVKG